MVLITRLQADRHENTRLALQVAAEHLGIPVRPSDTRADFDSLLS